MKKLFSENGAFTNKAMIVGVALAVVVAFSYFGSSDYLGQSIMDMLMGGTSPSCCTGRSCGSAGCTSSTNCRGVTTRCGGGAGCECTNYCDWWSGNKYCNNNCPHTPTCSFN